ncbi:50S ribosomal protein L20 [Candidatus Vidania fulgoroideorum]
MTRTKNCVNRKKKNKKIFKISKGFIGRRKNVLKISKISILKSLIYSYRDRKKKKSFFRNKWIKQINYKLGFKNINYNFFIRQLKLSNIKINRKIIFIFFYKNEYLSITNILLKRVVSSVGRAADF